MFLEVVGRTRIWRAGGGIGNITEGGQATALRLPPAGPRPRPGDPWAAPRGGGAEAVGRAVSLSVRRSGREGCFPVSRPLRLGQSRDRRLWLFCPGPARGWPRPGFLPYSLQTLT